MCFILSDLKCYGNLAYFKHLSVIVATQFATNEQLKDLTHMICL
jgi:hypothetical protein